MTIRDLLMAAAGAANLPTLIGSANAFAATGAITISKPANTQQGDLMIAVLSAATGLTWTLPSGWLLGSRTASNTSLTIAYKYAGASEGSSYTFTPSASKASGRILTYRNANFGYSGLFGTANTGGNCVAPEIGVADAGSIVFASFALDSGTQTFPTPTGMTLMYNDADANTSRGLFFQTFDSGPTGTKASDVTGNTGNVAGILFSIYPSRSRKTIQLVNAVSISGVAASPSSISVPSGAAANDLLLLGCAASTNISSALISGFAEIIYNTTNKDSQHVQFQKFASTPPSSYSSGIPSANNWVAYTAAIRNAVVDVIGSKVNSGSTNSLTVPGITVSEDSSWLLCFAAHSGTGTSSPHISTPTGFTPLVAKDFSTTVTGPSIAVFYKQVNAGATGNVTVNFNFSDDCSACLVSLRPL